ARKLNGTLTGPGALTVTGPLNWAAGTMSGGGTTTARGGLVLNGSQVALSQRALVNTGTATFAGPPSSLGLQSGATFTNQAGGTLVRANDASISDFGGRGANAFVNNGTLQRTTSSGTASIGVALRNRGTGSVESGM